MKGLKDIMLDTVSFSIPLVREDFDVLYAQLSDYVALVGDGDDDVTMVKPGKVVAVVKTLANGFEKKAILHLSRYGSTGLHLKVKGNPISYLTGQNSYGHLDINQLLLKFMQRIEREVAKVKIGFTFNNTVRSLVKQGDITLNNLSFAGYTNELESEEQVKSTLSYLGMAYNTGVYGGRVTLANWLGVTATSYGEGETFELIKNDGQGRKSWSLSCYNKRAEAEAADGIVFDELGRRIRLDLSLSNERLRCAVINGIGESKGPVTVARFNQLMEKQGGVVKWAASVIDGVLAEAKLQTVLDMRFPKNLTIDGFESEYQDWVDGKRMVSKNYKKARDFFLAQGLDLTIHPDAVTAICLLKQGTQLTKLFGKLTKPAKLALDALIARYKAMQRMMRKHPVKFKVAVLRGSHQ